jgi:hypothetical protein
MANCRGAGAILRCVSGSGGSDLDAIIYSIFNELYRESFLNMQYTVICFLKELEPLMRHSCFRWISSVLYKYETFFGKNFLGFGGAAFLYYTGYKK